MIMLLAAIVSSGIFIAAAPRVWVSYSSFFCCWFLIDALLFIMHVHVLQELRARLLLWWRCKVLHGFSTLDSTETLLSDIEDLITLAYEQLAK